MKVTICSSMKNKHIIKQLLEESTIHDFLFPNLDFEPNGELSDSDMKHLQKDHFQAIQKADAIYVLNPDSYIGRMVTAEIGYAKALNKAIYFTCKSGAIELDVMADDFIAVEKLVSTAKSN